MSQNVSAISDYCNVYFIFFYQASQNLRRDSQESCSVAMVSVAALRRSYNS